MNKNIGTLILSLVAFLIATFWMSDCFGQTDTAKRKYNLWIPGTAYDKKPYPDIRITNQYSYLILKPNGKFALTIQTLREGKKVSDTVITDSLHTIRVLLQTWREYIKKDSILRDENLILRELIHNLRYCNFRSIKDKRRFEALMKKLSTKFKDKEKPKNLGYGKRIIK